MSYDLYNKITGKQILVSQQDYFKIRNRKDLTYTQQQDFYLNMDEWVTHPAKINVIYDTPSTIVSNDKPPKLKLNKKANVKNSK